MALPELDLKQHILYTAFYNTHVNPEYPITTQSMAADLLVSYPHIFPSTTKIFYTVKLLKQEGLVIEETQFDKREYESCMKTMQQQHRRMSLEKMEKKCRELAGLKGVLKLTEYGRVVFCMNAAPYLTGPSTPMNRKILHICGGYEHKP
jgi:hypothetical protein